MTAINITLALAALLGGSGVALLAAGAHAAGSQATIAGQMLLFHAPALMAAALAVDHDRIDRRTGLAAIAALALGAALFSGDLAVRGFLGQRLFAMAAPAGGLLLIAGWLMLAAAALVARR